MLLQIIMILIYVLLLSHILNNFFYFLKKLELFNILRFRTVIKDSVNKWYADSFRVLYDKSQEIHTLHTCMNLL